MIVDRAAQRRSMVVSALPKERRAFFLRTVSHMALQSGIAANHRLRTLRESKKEK